MYNIYTYTELLVTFSAQQKWQNKVWTFPLMQHQEVTDKKDMEVFEG